MNTFLQNIYLVRYLHNPSKLLLICSLDKDNTINKTLA